eukprot:8992118-Alexandrium_andersonii.AAC.1
MRRISASPPISWAATAPAHPRASSSRRPARASTRQPVVGANMGQNVGKGHQRRVSVRPHQ